VPVQKGHENYQQPQSKDIRSGAVQNNNFVKVKTPSMVEEEKHTMPTNKGGYNAGSRSRKQENSDDDDNEVIEEAQSAIPEFLKNVPGVTATDSMGYRIEALRVHLEKHLGDIPFLAAYKHLVVSLFNHLINLFLESPL